MSATNPAAETLALLRSIDASLKQLVAQSRQAAPAAATTKPVASDKDLDGPYGNPKVPVNPRDWTGPTYKGRTLSECPPDFLDLLAETYEWFGKQADAKQERTTSGKPVGDYKRQDAARARGWAVRIRKGIVGTPVPANGNGSSAWYDASSDVGF